MKCLRSKKRKSALLFSSNECMGSGLFFQGFIQADTHQSCDVRVYEEEDEEEDACPVTMWFAWHMHTHQEEEEEEEEIEQTPEEALFEAAEEV